MTGYGAALVLILNVSYADLLILLIAAWVAAISVVILSEDRRAVSHPDGAMRARPPSTPDRA